MKRIIASLKSINYRLFFSLFIFGLLPTLYTTFRIYLIGQLPETYAFSIAGQLQWVSILYEIIQEALILPLFYFIGAVLSNKDELLNRIRTGLLFTFIVYTILSLLIIIFANPLVKFMAQDPSLIEETVTYIRLETVAMIFATLMKFLMVVIVTIKNHKNIYIVLIAQLVLTVILDIFFVSNLGVSLKLGINGIPITNIIVNLLMFVLLIFILYKNDLPLFRRIKLDFAWFKDFFKKGSLSGLESFVRNIVFILMVVRMVNVVGEQGTFWVANNFIWGWLLLPVMQLGELIKSDCGEDGFKAVEKKSLGYFTLTLIFVVIWAITIPLWSPFMQHLLKLSNYNDVYYLVLISLGFYILFAFNNVIDSIFYGLGKTNLMLYQSLLINIVFYGIMFILFKVNVFVPSLTLIAIMFGTGIALDSLFTLLLFIIMLKKEQISIFNVYDVETS